MLPFVFGKPTLTDDALVACGDEAIIKNLGTIQLKFIRVDRQSHASHLPKVKRSYHSRDTPVLNENSKKALLSHQAQCIMTRYHFTKFARDLLIQ